MSKKKFDIFFVLAAKKMSSLVEGKIECDVGNRDIFFMQDKKAKNPVFLFLTSGFAVFFVSESWYCQIQTPRQTNHVLLHIFDGGGVYRSQNLFHSIFYY